ncbi:hypothetical protein [Candidatus Williamhamiltonella defendens]|nr:hypothetical protein [Candidatus Hamiltonella defensa]
MSNLYLSPHRAIRNKYIQNAIKSSSKEEATRIEIWEKIKDWFCGTNTIEALGKLYDLTHHNDKSDTESAFKKVSAFYQLKKMACPGHQDKFWADIADNEDGTYTFSFSIEDVIDEFKVVYGNTEDDISAIKKRELTNDSEILEKNTVIGKVKYDREQNKLEGISSANQRRVGLHLLDESVKQKMAIYQGLAQEWTSFQMKCFDYYAQQRSSLDSINGLNMTSVIGTADEWVYQFSQSINEIRTRTQKIHAKQFHDTINNFKINAAPKLLEEIDNYILENNKKYPLAYEHVKKYPSDKDMMSNLKVIRELALNFKITGLMSDTPDAGLFLEHLRLIKDEVDIVWSSIHKNDPKQQLDQGAYRDCARGVLSQLWSFLSAGDKEKMLENMEGQFGQRLRGVVELAAEEVGQNEEDRILISTIYKYSFLMEDVVVTLRNDLGKEEFVVGNPENIKQLSELINSEIQALLQVGIDLSHYPSGGVDKTVLSY